MGNKFDLAQILGDQAVGHEMDLQEIPLDKLRDNPLNFFDVSKIDTLADNIALVGLQQPLIVEPLLDGAYMLIAGHRRLAALKQLGRKTAPCVIQRQQSDDQKKSKPKEILRLITTNTEVRELSVWERNEARKQIEAQLIALKKNGTEMPGKLRSYVAEALKMQESEIQRLKTIDEHLSGKWKTLAKKSTSFLPESRLDLLAHQPETVQDMLYNAYHDKLYELTNKVIVAAAKAETYDWVKLKCPKSYSNEPCTGFEQRAKLVADGLCPGCCAECDKSRSCAMVCGKVKRSNAAADTAAAEQQKREAAKQLFLAQYGDFVAALKARLVDAGVDINDPKSVASATGVLYYALSRHINPQTEYDLPFLSDLCSYAKYLHTSVADLVAPIKTEVQKR